MNTQGMHKLALALAMAALLAAVAAAPAAAIEPPTVTTEAATEVAPTQVLLNATIDTHGGDTLYGFEYGTTTAYGSYTKGGVIPAGETPPTHVTAKVTGLTPQTTYHFRVVAFYKEERKGADAKVTTGKGLYMVGEASEKKESQPKFVKSSEAWGGGLKPSAVGLPETHGQLTFFDGEGSFDASCGSYTIAWPTAQVPGSELTASVTSTEKCTIMGLPAKVTMNGCSYTYHVANAGPPYSGSVEIACEKAGSKIEIDSTGSYTGWCGATISAQNLGGTVAYQNESVEKAISGYGGVRVSTAATGLAIAPRGWLCEGLSGSGLTMGGEFILF